MLSGYSSRFTVQYSVSGFTLSFPNCTLHNTLWKWSNHMLCDAIFGNFGVDRLVVVFVMMVSSIVLSIVASAITEFSGCSR